MDLSAIQTTAILNLSLLSGALLLGFILGRDLLDGSKYFCKESVIA